MDSKEVILTKKILVLSLFLAAAPCSEASAISYEAGIRGKPNNLTDGSVIDSGDGAHCAFWGEMTGVRSWGEGLGEPCGDKICEYCSNKWASKLYGGSIS